MSTFSVPGLGPTSVPAIQFTPEGPVLPTDADIPAGAQIDIDYAFGGGTNPALSTPQGQIATSTTAIVSDKNSQIAYVCNQVDPQYAEGRFQDAIARIYFLTRKGATSTVVSCVLGGVGNTLVPAGTLAQDSSGNTYTLLGDVTIPTTGAVNSSWANLATGPIPCPTGTLNKVYQTVPGWDTITNPADGVLGQNVETPSEFEVRRKNSVALNGHGTPPAIYAAVFQVADVLDCYVIDNPSDSTVLAGSTNYPLRPHSIYVGVVGGLDDDIATAIWNKKDAGCDYNGNTTVSVVDPSGYNYPPPSYAVTFNRPTALPIYFAVQIAASQQLPSNVVDLITQAIFARFNGTDGTARERMGSIVLATRYYGAIGGVAPSVILLGVQVGIGPNPTTTSVQVGIDQYPTLNVGSITVKQQ